MTGPIEAAAVLGWGKRHRYLEGIANARARAWAAAFPYPLVTVRMRADAFQAALAAAAPVERRDLEAGLASGQIEIIE